MKEKSEARMAFRGIIIVTLLEIGGLLLLYFLNT